jgi:HPt (histidine-containing phosphotransfer) domain-containing protein
MADPPLVDPDRLRAVRDDYGALAGQLVDLYETTALETVAALRAALAAGDADEVRRLAHRLKGSARNVGATGMGDLAATLEPGPPDAADRVERLAAALAPTCAALRAALES